MLNFEDFKRSVEESRKSGGRRVGLGFCEVLTLIFIVLKMFGTIAWSWWWVLAPLWIPFGIILVLIVVIVLLSAFFD